MKLVVMIAKHEVMITKLEVMKFPIVDIQILTSSLGIMTTSFAN